MRGGVRKTWANGALQSLRGCVSEMRRRMPQLGNTISLKIKEPSFTKLGSLQVSGLK
jgi:hypothetical protein